LNGSKDSWQWNNPFTEISLNKEGFTVRKLLAGFIAVIFLAGPLLLMPGKSESYYNSTLYITADYRGKKVNKFKVYYRRLGNKKFKYYGKTENGKHSHNWSVGVVYEIMVLKSTGSPAAATIRYKIKNSWSQNLHFSLFDGAQPWR
jgi:hypothetical protein